VIISFLYHPGRKDTKRKKGATQALKAIIYTLSYYLLIFFRKKENKQKGIHKSAFDNETLYI
jgi:hypothetical protein